MTRDRYDNKEKEHFHYINLNPVGRHTADCVIRAMAMFFNWTWTEMMKELCSFCCENGYMPNYKSGYKAYLICQGCPPKTPPEECTVKEFLEKYASNDNTYLVTCSNHMTCIKDGRINDTWDCSNRRVKNYWEIDTKTQRKRFYEQ